MDLSALKDKRKWHGFLFCHSKYTELMMYLNQVKGPMLIYEQIKTVQRSYKHRCCEGRPVIGKD